MPEVFADYPQRHLLATSWALCFRKIYVYHIIIFVLDQIMNAKIRIFSVSAKFSSIFRNRYVRYSRASVIILSLAVLAMPVAIFSTTLLYIVGPAVLLALLFFNLTFIALGSSYIPTEELLDKEVENDALVGTKYRYGGHFLLNSRPLLIAEQNLYNHFPMSAEISSRKVLMHGVRI